MSDFGRVLIQAQCAPGALAVTASGIWSAMSAIFMMLLALCFVLFLAWYLLRFLSKRMPGARAAGAIQILDRVNIGREKSLLIVKAGDKTLLVGMSDNAVATLCEFDDDTQFSVAAQPEPNDFSAILQSAAKKFPAKHRHEETNSDEN